MRRLRQGRCHDCAAGGPFSIATTIMLQRFASLGLKSRIDARKRLFSGKSLHRFPSLALKSRIDVRKRLFSGKSLHRFPSLGLKSRIDASVGVVVFCRRAIFSAATKIRIGRGGSLPRRPQQAKPFSFAATKIRIGRGGSLQRRPQQAKPFSFAATKIRIGRERS